MNHMIQYELEWTDQKQRNKWSHNETGQLCPETKWTETKYKLRETWNRVQKQICVQRNKCSIWIEKQCSNKDHETKSFRSTVYEIKSKWSSEAETKLEQMILLWTETDWIRNSSGSNVARSETWSTSETEHKLEAKSNMFGLNWKETETVVTNGTETDQFMNIEIRETKNQKLFGNQKPENPCNSSEQICNTC